MIELPYAVHPQIFRQARSSPGLRLYFERSPGDPDPATVLLSESAPGAGPTGRWLVAPVGGCRSFRSPAGVRLEVTLGWPPIAGADIGRRP